MKLFKKKKEGAEKAGAVIKKRPMDRRRLANGSYWLAISAIVIAMIVVINLIVSAVPSKFTTFDLTSGKLYSIGSTTKKLLDSLDQDVTLNYLSQSSSKDETVEKMLESYEGYSSHIKLNKVDLVSNPTFTQQYTTDTVSANSVIVTCGDKSKVVSYDSMYEYDSSSYYYSSSASAYDGEGQVTSAISYVTSDSSKKIYYTSGHSELSLSTEMTDAISKANLDSEELKLSTTDIPDDCAALLIYAPGTDFTEAEAAKVKTYLANGGHAMIISMSPLLSGTSDMPNFDSIMAAYGVQRTGGLVLEGNASNYMQAPYLMIPNMSSADANADLTNTDVLFAFAEGLTVSESSDATYTVSTLYSTSDQAYVKTDLSTTAEKEDGDQSGSFPVAVQVTDTLSNDSDGSSDTESTASSDASSAVSSDVQAASDVSADSSADSSVADGSEADSTASPVETKETKILYYTTPAVFNASVLSSLVQSSLSLPDGNTKLLSDSLTFLTDSQITVSVASKSLSTPQTTISSGIAGGLGTTAMVALPAAFLIAGVMVWFRRRSK